MIYPAEPILIEPPAAEPAWLEPGRGHYRLYRGLGSPAAIDWTHCVALLAAGQTAAVIGGLGHLPDTDYYYGLRAVSDAGVEETGQKILCRVRVDEFGNLIGDRPAAVAFASIAPEAGGKVRLTALYIPPATEDSGYAAAENLQVADGSLGAPDWGTLLGEFPLAGLTRIEQVLEQSWSEGFLVRLAVRAVTADGLLGQAGPVRFTNWAVASLVGPPPVEWLEVSRSED
jgi:hypothetical protein